MERPSECPNCGTSWEGYEPPEAMVKPTNSSQFEVEYYTELGSSGWKCRRCGKIVE
jgi:rubrerythrin